MEKLISPTDLYESLSKKFDRETARTLTDFVRVTVDEKYKYSKDEFVTKGFLRAELNALSEKFTKDLTNMMIKTISAILIPIALMFLSLYLKK